MVTEQYQTLDRIHPYGYGFRWTVKVRISKIADIHHFVSQNVPGKVQNLVVIDEKGNQMQVVLYNTHIDKFGDILKEGSVYIIKSFKLSNSPKKFRMVPHKFQMSFVDATTVQKVEDDCPDIPLQMYAFIKFNNLRSFMNDDGCLTDAIGILVAVNTPTNVFRKDGTQSTKIHILLVDDTSTTITITLWGVIATKYQELLLKALPKKTIILATSLSVTDFKGVFSLSSTSLTSVSLNPSIEECTKLMEWQEHVTDSEIFTPTFATNQYGISTTVKARVTLDELISSSYVCPIQPMLYAIKATIVRIHSDGLLWFVACTTCKKKVEQKDEICFCHNCNTKDPGTILRYLVKIDVQDYSNETTLVLFDKEAEFMFGCSATELQNLKISEDGTEKFYEKVYNSLWKEFLFHIKVTPENYQFITNQGFTASKIEVLDNAVESRTLLEKLEESNAGQPSIPKKKLLENEGSEQYFMQDNKRKIEAADLSESKRHSSRCGDPKTDHNFAK